MASQIQIDQAGLAPAGSPGISRTDGLDDGSVVTLTNTGSGSTTLFRLLDVPLGDTTAAATLTPTGGDPKVWEFTPTAGVFGTYLIELIEDQNQVTEKTERRIFGIRLQPSGLLIPGLNEIADPTASLINDGAGPIEASDDNAIDYTSNALLNDRRYAGWWRKMYELFITANSGGGGGAVSSVFGRSGAVLAVSGDYDSDQVDNASSVPGASVSAALDALAGASAPTMQDVFDQSALGPASPLIQTSAGQSLEFSDAVGESFSFISSSTGAFIVNTPGAASSMAALGFQFLATTNPLLLQAPGAIIDFQSNEISSTVQGTGSPSLLINSATFASQSVGRVLAWTVSGNEYIDLPPSTPSGLQANYDVVNTIVSSNASGPIDFSGTEEINLTAGYGSTGNSSFSIQANNAGPATLSIASINSGAGTANIFVSAEDDLFLIAGGANGINLASPGNSQSWNISGNSPSDIILGIGGTNSGAGIAQVNIGADSAFFFCLPGGSLSFDGGAGSPDIWPSAQASGFLQNDGAGNLTWAAGTPGSNYQTIEDAGTPVAQQPSFNFTGAGVTVTDDPGNSRTNIDIAGGGGGVSAYDAVVTSKLELSQVPGVIVGGGVVTIPAGLSIFCKGTINFTNTAGIPGATFSDRLQLSSDCLLAGGGPFGNSRIQFSSNDALGCINIPAAVQSGVSITGLELDNASGGARIGVSATSGDGWTIENCIFDQSNGNHINVLGTLVGGVLNCFFRGGTNFVEITGAVAEFVMRSCRQLSGGSLSRLLFINSASPISELSVIDCRTVTLSSGGISVNTAITIGSFEVRGCEIDGSGTSISFGSSTIEKALISGNQLNCSGLGVTINTVANLQNAIVINNVFEGPNAFSCFQQIGPDNPTASPGNNQTRILRANLSIQGTQRFLLHESDIQTNAPPT